VNAAGIRIFARKTQVTYIVLASDVNWRIEALHRDTGGSDKRILPFRKTLSLGMPLSGFFLHSF
jgi:hypothetical protein